MDINLLVKITSRAWSLHILALLAEGVPGRQAPLLTGTGAGRTAFAASLMHLVELGLLERNPGHGHPLRPEYRLTEAGDAAASMARAVLRLSPPDAPLLRRAWTLPVLAATGRPRRFTQIRAALPRVTDRALSQSLAQLQAQNWLRRSFDVTHRLEITYQAADLGARLSQAVAKAG